MNFGELRFWYLLVAGLLAIGLVRLAMLRISPAWISRYDRGGLGLLGLFLLFCVSWLTFAIFVVVLLMTYVGLVLIVRYFRGSKLGLALLIPLNLAPLFYYKYAYFFGHEVLGFEFSSLRQLLIPVGISFYSFQMVSFVIDTLVLRNPLPKFLDYLNFAVFFPQIVAGPIERRHELFPQMQAFRFRYNPEFIDEGARWIVLGLFFKCCLADNLAEHFDRSSVTNPFLIWKANILFGLRIYYDFAGYSLIALGLGRCLGIQLTMNFQSPYCSNSIIEFWRRWHISLSQWFRDYVYIPLGGGKVRWWAFNVLLVFVVSGIWHGAGWNFLLWGLFHGVFLVLNRLFPQKRAPRSLAWGVTMLLVFFSWLSFYETRTSILVQKVVTLCQPALYSADNFRAFTGQLFSRDSLVLLSFMALAGVTLVAEWLSVRHKNEPYFYLRSPVLLVLMVIGIVILTPGIANDFIYFAF